MRLLILLLVCSTVLTGCTTAGRQPDAVDLRQQVLATERAFARTMADRDHVAFTGFLSSEIVFLSGDKTLRGRQQVAEGWKKYFQGARAPFSWKPVHVEVLDSGKLALSSGPVYNPEGRQFAVFTSIWRLEEPGVWRIVFDRGTPVAE